jgi:hypothetical protein
MNRVSQFQAVTQSVLATALIFAATIGYWSVNHYQVPSADQIKCFGGESDTSCVSVSEPATTNTNQTAAVAPTTISLGRILLIATVLSVVTSAVILRRTLTSSDD